MTSEESRAKDYVIQKLGEEVGELQRKAFLQGAKIRELEGLIAELRKGA